MIKYIICVALHCNNLHHPVCKVQNINKFLYPLLGHSNYQIVSIKSSTNK